MLWAWIQKGSVVVFALHVATHTCAGVGIGIAIQGGPAVTAACKSNIGYEVWCAIGTVLLGCRLLYQVSILRCGNVQGRQGGQGAQHCLIRHFFSLWVAGEGRAWHSLYMRPLRGDTECTAGQWYLPVEFSRSSCMLCSFMHLLAVCAPAQDVVICIHHLVADVGEAHILQRRQSDRHMYLAARSIR